MTSRNKVLLALLFSIALVVILLTQSSTEGIGVKKIAIFQVVRHPALDAMADRFRTELSSKAGNRVVIAEAFYADGNAEKTEQIASQVATSQFDLAFVIGTEQARSLQNKNKTLPIVLGGATDAVGSGLVESWDQPGGNITGTSDLSPIKAQLTRLREILPNASRVGVLYNPNEGNSRVIVESLKKEAATLSIAVTERTLSNAAEVRQAVLSLEGIVDGIYAPTDATVQSAIEAVVQAANEAKIPVFAVDKNSAQKGALFSVGFDYSDFGRMSAEMAYGILFEDLSPSTMPLRKAEKSELFFNTEQAARLKVTVPKEWLVEGINVSKVEGK